MLLSKIHYLKSTVFQNLFKLNKNIEFVSLIEDKYKYANQDKL